MKIFISYRRAEDKKSNFAGTIRKILSEKFGKDDVFLDTYDIAGGSEWRKVLEHEANNCRVMLVVIGPDWATLTDSNGRKRLFEPNDVTRWEVETGLRRSDEGNATLIPVLVTGANIPAIDELPNSLRALLDKNAVSIRNHPDFDRDMEKLIHDIESSQGFFTDDKPENEFEPEMVYISKGPFWMGSTPGVGIPEYETPRHKVSLPAYRIGKYPITNTQYEEFIRETKRPVTPMLGWDGQRPSSGSENYPVVGVTWFDALEYCEWLGEYTGRKYALPNEAQWEKACRGGNDFTYPWGNEFETDRCNHGRQTLAPVDAYPEQNDFGCYDFVGNVLQWTCSLWGEKSIAPDTPFVYPWKADRRRNEPGANPQIRRVVRGSSMAEDAVLCRCSARRGQAPNDVGAPRARHGFRVLLEMDN